MIVNNNNNNKWWWWWWKVLRVFEETQTIHICINARLIEVMHVMWYVMMCAIGFFVSIFILFFFCFWFRLFWSHHQHPIKSFFFFFNMFTYENLSCFFFCAWRPNQYCSICSKIGFFFLYFSYYSSDMKINIIFQDELWCWWKWDQKFKWFIYDNFFKLFVLIFFPRETSFVSK